MCEEFNHPVSALHPMVERARQLRRHATIAEARIWSLVRSRRCSGLRFLRQAQVGQCILDFYCPAIRLAIVVDGSVHTEEEVRHNDQARQQATEEEMRVTFLRLTNKEVEGTSGETLAKGLLAATARARELAPPYNSRPSRIR